MCCVRDSCFPCQSDHSCVACCRVPFESEIRVTRGRESKAGKGGEIRENTGKDGGKSKTYRCSIFFSTAMNVSGVMLSTRPKFTSLVVVARSAPR